MTYNEETYLLDSIEQIRRETHENNIMLRQICQVINVHLARHNQENEDDFGRNVLANLISSLVNIKSIGKK